MACDLRQFVRDSESSISLDTSGNRDWLQSKQSWHNAQQPASFPASLYLSAKPAFFGTNPQPRVDPITGTTTTLPAKARYDAGTQSFRTAPGASMNTL